MLVTFTTDAHANITMFEQDALTMLRMMGHSGTVPGAILAADVPVALSRLTVAIDAEKSRAPAADENENEKENEDAEVSLVSMANRGLPLINLLAAAAKEDCNVMWK